MSAIRVADPSPPVTSPGRWAANDAASVAAGGEGGLSRSSSTSSLVNALLEIDSPSLPHATATGNIGPLVDIERMLVRLLREDPPAGALGDGIPDSRRGASPPPRAGRAEEMRASASSAAALLTGPLYEYGAAGGPPAAPSVVGGMIGEVGANNSYRTPFGSASPRTPAVVGHSRSSPARRPPIPTPGSSVVNNTYDTPPRPRLVPSIRSSPQLRAPEHVGGPPSSALDWLLQLSQRSRAALTECSLDSGLASAVASAGGGLATGHGEQQQQQQQQQQHLLASPETDGGARVSSIVSSAERLLGVAGAGEVGRRGVGSDAEQLREEELFDTALSESGSILGAMSAEPSVYMQRMDGTDHGSSTLSEDAFDDHAEEVVSVLDVTDEPTSARAGTRPVSAARAAQRAGRTQGYSEEPPWSPTSSAAFTTSWLSEGSPQRLRATEAAESAVLEGTLGAMLRRLTTDSIEESATASVRRVLQLGAVMTGHRLSDEEIRALPKVRFEAKEQQHCSICLEAYKQGQLLTATRCNHFFHVECLAGWMQRATQCPLCRQECGPAPAPVADTEVSLGDLDEVDEDIESSYSYDDN